MEIQERAMPRRDDAFKTVFVSWSSTVPRSKGIAQALRARNLYVERMTGAPRALLPLRYLLQCADTLRILWRERPRLIIAMNPPIVLPLVVWAAARWLKAGFVIDSHTGAFAGRWRWFQPLHCFLARRAVVTLVTNEPLRAKVASWGAAALVMEDRVPELPACERGAANECFTVGVISSFRPDEPIDAILAAARLAPDVRFQITGRVPAWLAKRMNQTPHNVTFTGFLPQAEYVALLNKVDALMVLVNRDLTLLCGAYEAVAVGKPLITSDWPVLKEYFNSGAIYVDNSAESILAALREAALSRERLACEMRELKTSLAERWNARLEAFRARVNGAQAATAGRP